MTKPFPRKAIRMRDLALDLPNLCSLAGLFCAVLSLFASLHNYFPAAVLCMLWAVFFDYGDGIIARRMPGRPTIYGEIGRQLDSLIDIISFGACPAVFLMSLGDFSFFLLPPVFCLLGANALRLSCFNVFGLNSDGSYTGLSLDNNVLILAFIFLFRDLFAPDIFLWGTGLLFIGLSLLNLAPFAFPKVTGRGVWGVALYIIAMTLVYPMVF